MMTFVEQIQQKLAECVEIAREQGWNGDESDFSYSRADMDYVVGAVGRKPTMDEWKDAGLAWVGSEHISDDEE